MESKKPQIMGYTAQACDEDRRINAVRRNNITNTYLAAVRPYTKLIEDIHNRYSTPFVLITQGKMSEVRMKIPDTMQEMVDQYLLKIEELKYYYTNQINQIR